MKNFNLKGIYTLSISAVICSLLLFSASAGEADTSPAEQMDSLLSNIYPADGPGASVLVVKDGKTIIRKAYGMGNIELNIPLRPDMVFRLGSITKQFTSAAIMKLVEQGKINLDDPMTKYLPDYPVHGYNITIENLLTHTSGIKSYTSLPEVMEQQINEDLTVQELTDTFKNQPMDFAPSTAYLYNNSGYSLLGAIIEKVSGKTYEEYIQEEIFTPLGMTHSYYGSFTKIIPNRVMGYHVTEDGVQNAEYISMRIPYSAGSLLSTVDDLQKWTDALYAGKVVSNESLQKMTTPYVLSNGKNAGSDKEDQGYGYALSVADLKGHRVVGHGGGINGFSTNLQRIEDEDLLVVILTNNASATIGPSTVTSQLFAIALDEPFVEPDEVKVKASLIKKYAGDYVYEKFGVTISISYADGKLYSQTMGGSKKQLRPSSKTDFFFQNDLVRISFIIDKSGKADKVRYYSAEGAPGIDFTANRKK